MGKLCDIAELLCVHQNLDWRHVLREVRRLGGMRMMSFAFCLTSNLLGTALRQEVMSKLRFKSAILGLVEHASEKMFRSSDYAAGDYMTSQRFDWLTREHLSTKLHRYYLTCAHGAVILAC